MESRIQWKVSSFNHWIIGREITGHQKKRLMVILEYLITNVNYIKSGNVRNNKTYECNRVDPIINREVQLKVQKNCTRTTWNYRRNERPFCLQGPSYMTWYVPQSVKRSLGTKENHLLCQTPEPDLLKTLGGEDSDVGRRDVYRANLENDPWLSRGFWRYIKTEWECF